MLQTFRDFVLSSRLYWDFLRGLVDRLRSRWRDLIHPEGHITFVLRENGQVVREWCVGHNIVMSWLSADGVAPTSGRDIIRRRLVPSTFSGSLASDSEAVIYSCKLGSGGTAETVTDTGLDEEISGSEKVFTEVEFDPSNPYVTFIARYDESEVNQTISEVLVLTARGDAFARKTFAAFTKNASWALELRYQLRVG